MVDPEGLEDESKNSRDGRQKSIMQCFGLFLSKAIAIGRGLLN